MSLYVSSQVLRSSGGSLSTTDVLEGVEDPRVPLCSVDLYIRPVVGHKGKAPTGAKHWLLYFDWGYYSATHEAQNKNNILTPSSNAGKPNAPPNCPSFVVKRIQDRLRVSPQTVEQKAKENQYGGRPYNILTTNCQVWARELARLLGFELPQGQAMTYTDATLTTVVVGAGTAALAAAALNQGNKRN